MTQADFDARIDALTATDLRDAGSVKWTRFPDTIGAFVAEMDFGLAPAVNEAVSGALDRGLTGYLPTHLTDALAAATARWYAETYGWHVPAERVHVVPDVIAAFEVTMEQFISAEGAIIVPTPAYMPFLSVPPMLGRRVIEVPSIEVDGRMLIDPDGLRRAFDDGGELLVLCNPHNPIGTVATRAELLEIAAIVDEKGGRVFSDEIHAPLVYAPGVHVPYASISQVAAEHTVTAASASKAWNLAGFKCAQVILSNEADEAAWESFGQWAGHGTSTLGVVANVAAYESGRPWLDEVLTYLDGNRRLLASLVDELLPGVRMLVPEGTYIALLDFRGIGLEGDLAEWFRERAGVSMTDGSACGEAAIGYTRFVFAMPRPLLREAIERIAGALAAREGAAA
ncbi:aminotransferase class I/II-fold pyridoxal phosphate-dependent enzyme [Microbacterium sp. LRZ72]|uniref:MalY/PatB family protein n=1 Tax=Microbacterium sp. LRZ72 TaxID=2942481 RepID=UPI0029A204B1|nr:aminotransferase class I/II-fold pyridoxal phosphate-dependent enzyme [Microbacterium sp. LRZ72]MDX2377687.1 aminotransferase class I/II-fold pyridoxal phosphate-dependent enzyme [Microbacterium sp. LRZ72]